MQKHETMDAWQIFFTLLLTLTLLHAVVASVLFAVRRDMHPMKGHSLWLVALCVVRHFPVDRPLCGTSFPGWSLPPHTYAWCVISSLLLLQLILRSRVASFVGSYSRHMEAFQPQGAELVRVGRLRSAFKFPTSEHSLILTY